MNMQRSAFAGLVWLALVAGASAQDITCEVPTPASGAAFEYFVSLADLDHHAARVQVRYRDASPLEFQMPRWNALYQIRDFAQYVSRVHAVGREGQPLPVEDLTPSSWRVAAGKECAIFSYDVYAGNPGPFGAELNLSHAFFNWAEVLAYPRDNRQSLLQLTITDVPSDWNLHDLGLFDEKRKDGRFQLSRPVLYDQLVDSPAELGNRATVRTFEDSGAKYRLVFDAECQCDLDVMEAVVQRIVRAGVDWMQDRPYGQYTFLYHIPRSPAGGGMEHANGAAIDATAEILEREPRAIAAITAHEFFHLWNVKRIRPQGLEPVDYTRQQDTSALWFSEGVTSTVGALLLVRAGLADEQAYIGRLAGTITEFESRPARLSQSPEQSGIDAWFEGYTYYNCPERSVSYYVSGELLGALLDLRIRALTDGHKSLRDLFQWMDRRYAHQGRFFENTRGVQEAAEAITGNSFEVFFRDYVRGTRPVEYDRFLQFVGLKLTSVATETSNAGFDAIVGFSGPPRVISVQQGSAAAAAGVRAGDTIVSIDGKPLLSDLTVFLTSHKPGESLTFRIASRSAIHDVKITLTSAQSRSFRLVDVEGVSAGQRAQRAAWIRGDDVPAGEKQ